MNLPDRTLKKTFLLSFIIIISLYFQSCKNQTPTQTKEKKINIVVTTFPIYDFSKNIGLEKVSVTKLLPPGIEAHSFEPKPDDIIKINNADIFFYTDKNMEVWAENIIKGIENKKLTIKEVSEGISFEKMNHNHKDHSHKSNLDPHIWLDFDRAKKMVDNIAHTLSFVDTANSSFYQNNAENYKLKLEGIDKKYRNTLNNCKSKDFIHIGHFAFGYLAKKYGLNYITAYKGLSPDEEPSPNALAKIIEYIKRKKIKYIFYEDFISPRMAEVISHETNSKLLKINAGHNVSKDDFNNGVTFIDIMERNLISFREGLECQ